MSNLNLQEASLLDASGELDSPARRQLMARISGDSAAQQTFRDTHENFTLLSVLPIPEPSAAERKSIPAAIKRAVHAALHQPEKEAAAPARPARRSWLLVRYASAGLALAACMTVCVTLVQAQQAQDSQNAHFRAEAARINAQIDHMAGLTVPSPVAAKTDFAEEKHPDALNALAALPPDAQATDVDDADYSAPPGSY